MALQNPLSHGQKAGFIDGKAQPPAIPIDAHQAQLTRIELGARLEFDHQTGDAPLGHPHPHLANSAASANLARSLGATGKIDPNPISPSLITLEVEGIEVDVGGGAQLEHPIGIDAPGGQPAEGSRRL